VGLHQQSGKCFHNGSGGELVREGRTFSVFDGGSIDEVRVRGVVDEHVDFICIVKGKNQ
jgi:hypothetical protein